MLHARLALVLAAASSAVAQITQANTSLVSAEFTGALITPQALDFSFDPVGTLDASFGGQTNVSIGQLFTSTDPLQAAPTLFAQFLSDANITDAARYTVAMIDVDVANSTESSQTKTFNRHWLVNDATYNPADLVVTAPTGQAAGVVVGYKAPGPASGSGPHRYVIMLLRQGPNFKTAAYNAQADTVSPVNIGQYVAENDLSVVAATYIQVRIGDTDPSVVVVSTSAVDTSSILAAASTAASSSASGSESHSGSASHSGSTTSSRSTASNASATPSESSSAAAALSVGIAAYASLLALAWF